MNEPKFERRKDDRPAEITDAAFEVFAEHGYERTRVIDVAKRAGVSKGLMYLYFKTKEELFKAVILRVIGPRVESLEATLLASDASAEALIRGPISQFMKQLPNSPVRVVMKLLISEGAKYPDLIEFYWQNVASKGLAMIRAIIDRGVERGEMRASALSETPQLVIAPMVMAVVWRLVFGDRDLDTDQLIDTHVEILVNYLKVEGAHE